MDKHIERDREREREREKVVQQTHTPPTPFFPLYSIVSTPFPTPQPPPSLPLIVTLLPFPPTPGQFPKAHTRKCIKTNINEYKRTIRGGNL